MRQKGNVLFLILIAVAMFAALSYAVTKSGSGDGNDISEEQAELYASQLIQFGTLLRQEFMRKKLSGVSEYEFDVSGNHIHATTANSTCTTTKCKIFSGDLTFPRWPEDMFDPDSAQFSAAYPNMSLFRVGIIPEVGSSDPELLLFVIGLKTGICRAINEKLGVYESGDTIANDSYGDTTLYSGDLTSFPTASGVLDGLGGTDFNGHRTFCFAHTNNNAVFIQSLIDR